MCENRDCITHPVRLFVAALLLSTAGVAQEISLRPIAVGLEAPVAMTHAKDARLFITQQRGIVRIHDGTSLLATPFLDIQSKVLYGGEQGLLSVAFHPNYRQNGYFYVYYNDKNGDIVIARYKVTSDPNVADPASETILLSIAHPTNTNHNGGQLAFGADGYLYAGTGDGGSGGDPPNNAQNLQVLLGKILRIDVDNGSPYGIPPSNPFVGNANARAEIWAYGMRNPWRFSFDRAIGDLFIADVGQGAWEEVDYQPVASKGGENYGWRIMEGTHCYNATTCNQTGLVLPIIEYGHVGGACSVTGGYRYRGTRYPRFVGTYIYADFCNGVIWGATQMQNGTWTSAQLVDAPFSISSFGEDVNGELYVADYAGRILQIEDTQTLSYPLTVTAAAASANSVGVTWSPVDGASSYELVRSADHINYTSVVTTSLTSYTDFGVQQNAAYLYKVRALGALGTGPFSNVDLATTLIFSDDQLVAGMTFVRAAHINELRTAINAVRFLAAHSPATFTDPTITPGVTPARAVHVSELRAFLDDARFALALAPRSYTDTTITPASTIIKAAHITQLRDGVK